MTNPGSARFARARRRVVLALALAALCVAAAPLAVAQQGTVRVQLASPTIALGESVRVAIVADGIDGELDASALEREFDVVGRSSSRDVQILNGERRSTVTWVLEIAPREVGVFTVPAVTVGGVESELVTLTVTEAPRGAARDVFVEAVVDTRTPWVQSQVLLTLSVFRAIDIIDGSLGEPAGNGLDVRALGDDTRREEERDGRRYLVVERRFALFPQRSGRLVVEPIALTVSVPTDPTRVRGFFAPTRRLTRRTEAIALDVRPRPDASRGWWLPASDVVLEEASRAGAAGGEVRVGEPLTRAVRLRASGVLDTQLPELATPDVDGLAIYADDPLRASDVGPDGIESTLTLSLAVIPERPGTFELPPVTLDWFDVEEGRARTASLPARTLTVLPGANAPAASVTGDPLVPDADAGGTGGESAAGGTAIVAPGGETPQGIGDGRPDDADGRVAARWQTLALAALAGWTLTGVALVVALRRRRAEPVTGPGVGFARSGSGGSGATVREARLRVERSVAEGDVPGLASAVLARAAARWPDDPPRSLVALARRVERPGDDGDERELARTLARLDAALYGGAPADAAALDVADLPTRLERALAAPDGRAPGPAGPERDARALPPL